MPGKAKAKATSKAQQHLMAAAEHGADFPMAKKVRKSMSHDQMREFAKTKTKDLPKHAGEKKKSGTREHATDPKKLEPMKKKAKEQTGRKHATDPKQMY